jgi:hypothetical protein
MFRLSAIDAVSPAFERMQSMLLRPIRFKNWLKIGFIGWLAGGAAFSGSYNFNTPSVPGAEGSRSAEELERMVRTFLTEYWPLIVLAVAFLIVLGLVFAYLSCRFRFILFDSVLQKDAQIGRGWTLYRRPAHRYLVFLISFFFIAWAAVAVVVGLPLWRAYKAGILRSDNFFPRVFGVLAVVFLGLLLFFIVNAIISSLANDFGVPLLALDNLTLGGAWSMLKGMILAEPGAFAGYLGMKLLLSIAAGIIVAIATVIVVIVLFIPGIILVLLGVALVKVMGTIGVAVGIFLAVIGVLAVVALVLVISMLATAPVTVFFTSYALYFFGGRYPKLGALVWPDPLPQPPAFSSGVPAPPAPAPL